MPDKRRMRRSEPLLLRFQAGSLFTPDGVASDIENMRSREEGTLRSVVGPAAYVPDSVKGTRPFSQYFSSGSKLNPSEETQDLPDGWDMVPTVYGGGESTSIPDTVYSHTRPLYGAVQHGIFHCTLQNGERDVLLLHSGDELWEFRGWQRDWRQILSTPAGFHGEEDVLPDDTQPRFPTQFEATGNGIVIVPQDSRAYFYDGHTIAPLGFSETPAPPQARGPENSRGGVTYDASAKRINATGVNDTSYAHDGMYFAGTAQTESGMTYGFGMGHLGTLTTINSPLSSFTGSGSSQETLSESLFPTGWMERGEWRCKVQFIDKFGNLSPLSEESEPVTFSAQSAECGIATRFNSSVEPKFQLDYLQKQVAWTGVPTGPDHCVGRILYRTKDLRNSGDANFYELSLNSSPVATAFATLPDNQSTLFPDNISDAQLFLEPKDADPVPRFKLCRVAFGRLWIANVDGAPGMLRASMPNKWGTFPPEQVMFPDPDANNITGLWRTARGLLVFTDTSTFIVESASDPSPSGSFRISPLASTVGCVAPNSIQTLPDGTAIWLGVDGFYGYNPANDSSVVPMSSELAKAFKQHTRSRMAQACSVFDPRTKEYRCWVSTNGSRSNNLCYVLSVMARDPNQQGWRTRTDMEADVACVTKDHRSYSLVGGRVTGDKNYHSGVYVLDRSGPLEDTELLSLIDDREAVVETAWLTAEKSLRKKTAYVLYLWLRETESSDITVEVMRDWRNKVLETVPVKRYNEADVPDFWDKAVLGATNTEFVTRRPYWTRAQVYVPSTEVFKFRIRGKGAWEFVGIQIDDGSRDFGGAQVPP